MDFPAEASPPCAATAPACPAITVSALDSSTLDEACGCVCRFYRTQALAHDDVSANSQNSNIAVAVLCLGTIQAKTKAPGTP
ncbi:hypothetical protein [uncultured Piscinibacter sp.]|uniref:hypothetical protein n=1 Tax=uncultured Piscinibacter sp. TaxID=1131835 RepID=UPI002609ABB4|nr:hypothetical protein [uncultured Piscinibacter sp.]